jgi:hypothetical protein
MLFVHMLLFECPGCGGPIATMLNCEHGSVEETDKQEIRLRCGSCDSTRRFIGLLAKRHFVIEWEFGPRIAGAVTMKKISAFAIPKRLQARG